MHCLLNIIVQDFSINWDYVQACFFALTILTTIGGSELNIELLRFNKLSLIVGFMDSWWIPTMIIFVLKILRFSGYGNFAARTFSGRLFCLLFGIIGIPFMLCVLADVGGIMAGLLQVILIFM